MMLLTLKFAIAALVFATGLSATREDLFWIWRRPGLLGRSFLAMYVLAPLVAIVMTLAFDLPRPSPLSSRRSKRLAARIGRARGRAPA